MVTTTVVIISYCAMTYAITNISKLVYKNYKQYKQEQDEKYDVKIIKNPRIRR